MQNECSKGNDNYYFLCRKKASEHNDALSSRLGAASRLNISESALRNYEVDPQKVAGRQHLCISGRRHALDGKAGRPGKNGRGRS